MSIDMGMTGGNKLKEALLTLSRKLGNDFEVKVGFLEGSMAGYSGPRPMKLRKSYKTVANYKRYHTIARSSESTGNTQPAPMIAFIMENGSPEKHIPPRPFFSQMIAKQSPTWSRLIAVTLKAHNYLVYDTMKEVGIKVKEQLVTSIEEFTTPPLKQSTIDRKGFDTPLQDSKNMKRAVDYAVVPAKGGAE